MTDISQQDLDLPDTTQPRSRFKSTFARNRKAQVGLAILALFVLAAVFAPLIAPYDPNEMTLDMMSRPSMSHWLGTDDLGRDLLSRIIWGTQISLLVGISTVTLALVAGVALGVLAGYYGGGGVQHTQRANLLSKGLPHRGSAPGGERVGNHGGAVL